MTEILLEERKNLFFVPYFNLSFSPKFHLKEKAYTCSGKISSRETMDKYEFEYQRNEKKAKEVIVFWAHLDYPEWAKTKKTQVKDLSIDPKPKRDTLIVEMKPIFTDKWENVFAALLNYHQFSAYWD